MKGVGTQKTFSDIQKLPTCILFPHKIQIKISAYYQHYFQKAQEANDLLASGEQSDLH